MKTIASVLCLLLIAGASEKRIQSTVVNAETGEAIPYVNIKVRGRSVGTSAAKDGSFSLDCLPDEELIFSAVGYKERVLKVEQVVKRVQLRPNITALAAVEVDPHLSPKQLVLGAAHKKLPSGYACGKFPRMLARYFKPIEKRAETPYLKSVKLLTRSKVKNARFNIRLYKVDESGDPGDYLYSENIIGIAPKGKNITEVDLSKLGIVFPEEGMYVCFEWLMVDANKKEYHYTDSETREKEIGVNYSPSIGADWVDSNDLMRQNIRGEWVPMVMRIKGKYLEPTFELTLSN